METKDSEQVRKYEAKLSRSLVRLKRSVETGSKDISPKSKFDASAVKILNAVEDEEIAAAAIKLVVSSSRKGIVTLCTKVALILKENIKLKKELAKLSKGKESITAADNKRNSLVLEDKVDLKTEDKMQAFKSLASTTRNLFSKNSSNNVNSVITTAEVHVPQRNDEKLHKRQQWQPQCPRPVLEETKEIVEGEVSENASQVGSESTSQNGIRQAIRFWKNKYLKQSERVEELERRLREPQHRLKSIEETPEVSERRVTSEKSVQCRILREMETEREMEDDGYIEPDGWHNLLRRLHDIPVYAPVILQGCRCTRCECMTNPIFYTNNKDAKMFQLYSKSRPLLQIGDLVLIPGNHVCRVAYVGHLDEPGLLDAVFVGLILRQPVGPTDGCHRGKRYFTCEKNFGLFFPINWIELIVKRVDRS